MKTTQKIESQFTKHQTLYADIADSVGIVSVESLRRKMFCERSFEP